MSKPNPEQVDHELPELDDAFSARARPVRAVMGEAFIECARRPGRPRFEAPKTEV